MDKPKLTEQTITGASFSNWFTLLCQNKFEISWKFLPRALFANLIILLFTPFRLYDYILYHRKIKKTKIEKPPIFILGHWRSGTSHLHSLITTNKRFSYASNLHTFMPYVFLGNHKFFSKIIADTMPKKRHMDNFKLRVDAPSEEEFAMANMMPYSIYNGLQFPRRRRYYAKFCSYEDVPPKIVKRFKKEYLYFIKKLTYYADGKQLVLKNPPNTARIKLLLEMFPDAKFINIHRNPYDVYPSTYKMYDTMVRSFVLQDVNEETISDYIIDLYKMIYERYFQDKDLIPKNNFVDIRYEDIIADPMTVVQKIYHDLNLNDFDKALPEIQKYINSQKSYKTNVHTLSPELEEKITTNWGFCFEKWGYEK